MTQDIPK